MKKIEKLKDILKQMGSVLIAFSGGSDSSFLLKIASSVLPKEKIIAVTADSPTYTRQELSGARLFAAALGVKHIVIKTLELREERFISNPLNRCYFCKRELFSRLRKLADEYKINFVIDGTNKTDAFDSRPGAAAKRELAVRSPLEESGIDKADIRRASKRLGLTTWNKPSGACLASRIAYGVKITPALLSRIGRAEAYLKRLGFRQVRLRHYNGLCRIEVLRHEIVRLINKRDGIITRLKTLGYTHITVDLEGYRTGSMNEMTGA